MKYVGMPPGNILQYIYLNNQIKRFKKEGLSNFLEIGSGNGYNSKVFLDAGFRGKGIDLNINACKKNKQLNATYISNQSYSVSNQDFFMLEEDKKYDVIFSCMVIEHMEDKMVKSYFEKAKNLLSKKGKIVCLVPASMKHWGIEDDIAGHIKRYELKDINNITKAHQLELIKYAGLTYPVSNWLLGLSNKIIEKKEKDLLNKTQKERTVYTGNREVQFKTQFPTVFNLILNSTMMYPLHLLQLMFKNNPNSMVLYFELK